LRLAWNVIGSVPSALLGGNSMHANPFDDDSAGFFVLINHEEHHSLWPSFAEIPVGWHVIYGKADRTACLGYIERNWPDIRSKSLREKLAQPSF
jgi:uncharacterized protein YbdZ (MbtH family)